MSRFTQSVGTTDTAGASSDAFTRNALACAGTGVLVGVGAGSVLVTAAIMPAQVIGATGIAAGLVVTGNRLADGKSINPFTKKDDADKTVAKSSDEAPASTKTATSAA